MRGCSLRALRAPDLRLKQGGDRDLVTGVRERVDAGIRVGMAAFSRRSPGGLGITRLWERTCPLAGIVTTTAGGHAGGVAVDPEFRSSALAERIVRGAHEPDLVRLHGSIVAALEIYGREAALRDVFVPALRRARIEHGRVDRAVAAAAIRDQLRLNVGG